MRAYAVVVTAPAFDHHLGLAQRVEDLAVQQLVAQAGVEGECREFRVGTALIR
jgi:hypothetical protein